MPPKPKTAKKRPKKRQVKSPNRSRWFMILGTAAIIIGTILFFRPWELLSKPPGRPIETHAELQIALARAGFSPGAVDGIKGSQTQQALRAYQIANDLESSGHFDEETAKRLRIEDPVFAHIEVTESALLALRRKPRSWKERGTMDRLGFNSLLEMIGERTQSDPDYIRKLNPGVAWSALRPGDRLLAPSIQPFRTPEAVTKVEIYLSERRLRLTGVDDKVLFHSPVSIARNVEKRPVGELKTTVLVEDPNYTFNPNILTTTAAREGITGKFVIQPGPNNPVGTVWIGLNRPSYGIHGTPEPEKVGRTESSGCFRLANWNAETVLHAVDVGTPVIVHP